MTYKLFFLGGGGAPYETLHHYCLFSYLLPLLWQIMSMSHVVCHTYHAGSNTYDSHYSCISYNNGNCYGNIAFFYCVASVPLSADVSRAENWALIRVLRSGVTAPVLPHTGPPGTDPLAESIPRNESAHRSRADRSTLIKTQVVRLAAERGTRDETDATHQRVHDQRRRLEAAHCDGMR